MVPVAWDQWNQPWPAMVSGHPQIAATRYRWVGNGKPLGKTLGKLWNNCWVFQFSRSIFVYKRQSENRPFYHGDVPKNTSKTCSCADVGWYNKGGMLVAKPRRPEQLSGERYSEKMKQTSHPTIKNCSSTLCLNAPISPYLNIINEILSCVMAKISKSSCLNHLKSSSFDRLSRLKGEFPSFSG